MFKLVTVALFTLVQVTVYCRPRAKSLDVVEQSISSVKVDAEKLLPPDHVDALKFEKDGHINKDYRKEIFLGNHEEMDDDPIEIAEAKLVDIFHKIDVDADGYLSDSELEQWILDRINAHMDEAVEENDAVFKHLDPDGDGFVEWKEYYKHFLLAKGHGVKETEKYLEDYDTDILKEDERDQLVRYKFKWTDADIDPIDNKLDKKEFFSFRHPEQSPQLVENMIMSIINSLDEDKDGNLTLKEFMTNPDEMMQEEGSEKEREEEREVRKREFVSAIDKNKDGIATKQELIDYMNPRNPQQSKQEANNLVSLMDDDKDGKLSLKEIKNHKDVFISSKIVNVKRVLHDEF
ncbi:45 kDa calcium-binding protein-like [Saccostrea cucullata]|uniref:45 kDa calcium-binding protein-like n=1 Tax=Saccostrea cuccullata TaxID=36930 RepID=UPI002ED20A3A